MGKTSTKVKDRYNEKTYKRYTIRVRYDDVDLIEKIEKVTKEKGISFNEYVTELIKNDKI